VACSLNFQNYFFNREVMWHEVIFLNFNNYFSIEKGDVAWYLNFQNYFSMKKDDVR
jgi:hypothetical protein